MTTISEHFSVSTDEGKELLVTVLQHWQEATSLSDKAESVPIRLSYRLSNGNRLSRIDDNTFQIIETEGYVRRKR